MYIYRTRELRQGNITLMETFCAEVANLANCFSRVKTSSYPNDCHDMLDDRKHVLSL